MIGRRHKGRVNQPNNHSKLTDSNNCTVLVLVSNLLLLLRRPSSLCLLPVTLHVSSYGDRASMLNAKEKTAQLI